MSRVGETLVLVMPVGLTPEDWARYGQLERDWNLLGILGPEFARVVLVFQSGEASAGVRAGIGDRLAKLADGRFDIQLVRASTERGERAASLVGALVPSGSCAVVRTDQLTAGTAAVTIRDELRARGCRVVLITRGGYLWSRFAAAEFGPDSREAKHAAETERALCRAADLVVGATHEMVNDLCWRYRLDMGRTAVIPNFVVIPEMIRPSTEREAGLIVSAGALVARKRLERLIEAVAALDEDLRSKVTLEIIGEGPEGANLRAHAERLGAPVRFREPLPYAELIDRLGRCLIYAQASSMEGHPKAVIDAMACGAVPVVADSPGLGSLIRTGSTGVLVPSGEPADFANAFTGLLSDTDWCDLLGGNAARGAAASFGVGHVAQLELDAMRGLLDRAPRSNVA
jgi:glycosyltransferase involved in cell wall biosynthesis